MQEVRMCSKEGGEFGREQETCTRKPYDIKVTGGQLEMHWGKWLTGNRCRQLNTGDTDDGGAMQGL